MRLTKTNPTQSVDKVVCKLDLCRAKVPHHKLGNEEYFRALQSHKTLSQPSNEMLSPEIAYMIDKEIRLQSRQQRQTVQTEVNPVSSSQVTTRKKKLKEKSSYTQWVKQKKFEERYKHALMMRALKSKYEKELLEQQEKEEKTSENFKRIKHWEHQKISENVRKRKVLKMSKLEVEARKEQKRREAEDNYREWLRRNMLKLKEEKRRKREEKQKEAQEQKLKEEKIEERKKKEHENFKKWLKDKKKAKKRVKTATKTQIKLKKPIMLAYSPNRKLGKAKESFHESSSEDSNQSSTIENDYPKKVNPKPNLFNNFNDLSSSNSEPKREEIHQKFENSSEEGGKIVQESFQENDSEYEEGSEQFEEGSEEYEEGSEEFEEGSEEYEEGSEENEESYEEGSEYEDDSNDKANNSY